MPKDARWKSLQAKAKLPEIDVAIDVISDIELKAENESSKDLLGRAYEYFLGEFANAEGKKGGQFYTPKSIVKLMVEIIEPYTGMFVMSEKFVEEHKGEHSGYYYLWDPKFLFRHFK